jgi:dipeptidyl aminopeptidase/acylaminoacyl peptidase
MVWVRFLLAIICSASLVGMAARAAPPIDAYGKLPAISDVALSPSGGRIAIVMAEAEQRSLLVSTTDGKLLHRVDLGLIKVRQVFWAGEDHVLVFTSATVNLGFELSGRRGELLTALALDLRSGKSFQVFGRDHARSVANTIRGYYGPTQIDGHWYGWFGGITYGQDNTSSYLRQGFADLYRVDLDNGDITMAAHGLEDIDDWLIGPGGDVLARSFYFQRTGDWQVLAGKSGNTVLAAGHADFVGAGPLHLGSTADRLLVSTPIGGQGDDRDAVAYRDLSLTGGPERPVPNGDQIVRALRDPATQLSIGAILEGDALDAVLFPSPLQARWRGTQKAFPGRIAHLESFSADFGKIAVRTDGGDDSGTYWLVDIAQHSADPIGTEYPTVKSADVGSTQMVNWRAADGLDLHGVLTLPPGHEPKSLPLVVLPHGGPEERDYQGFDWWAQAYASRGYAVFQPNFRGSNGYGTAFRNAGLGQWGRKMQTDISDGVADLSRKGIVDPRRACIIGASYGGYAALAGVTVQHGLYRCAVSVAGISDLAAILTYDHKRTGGRSATMRYWQTFMGVASAGDPSLKAISPAELAPQADAPILLIHGKDDTVVPIDQSETMESALKHAGKPVELVTLDGEDHWLSQEKTRIKMLTAAVAFVEKHNPPN